MVKFLKKTVITAWVGAFMVLLASGHACAQNSKSDHDSSYFISYPNQVLSRYYFSKKYTNVVLDAPRDKGLLRYKPNTTLNMGVGATYRGLTLNLAYGFPFLNQEKEKGKTRYLDLQSHLYSRKWSYDFWGQLYKGYFLRSDKLKAATGKEFYLRPDMGVTLLGVSAYRILQSRTFSYRAAFIQDEWQLKSAGSWLIGAEVYYGRITADSAFVPSLLAADYEQRGIDKIRFMDIGPGAGYGYNWVYRENFFLGLAATVNLNIGFVREVNGSAKSEKISFSPNFIYRATTGYNSEKWSASLSLVGNRVSVNGTSASYNYVINTGNYRATLAYRFKPGKKLRKYLEPVDKLLRD